MAGGPSHPTHLAPLPALADRSVPGWVAHGKQTGVASCCFAGHAGARSTTLAPWETPGEPWHWWEGDSGGTGCHGELLDLALLPSEHGWH